MAHAAVEGEGAVLTEAGGRVDRGGVSSGDVAMHGSREYASEEISESEGSLSDSEVEGEEEESDADEYGLEEGGNELGSPREVRRAWWLMSRDDADPIGTSHFRTIDCCSVMAGSPVWGGGGGRGGEGETEREEGSGVSSDFVCIVIRGESFMLHQVRHRAQASRATRLLVIYGTQEHAEWTTAGVIHSSSSQILAAYANCSVVVSSHLVQHRPSTHSVS